MAHLLMVESWVGAMSNLLPRAIVESGHRFTLVTRDLHHYLRGHPAGRPHPLLLAENILRAETNDPAALRHAVTRLHPALCFDGVVTSCDYYLGAVADLAARLGLPGAGPEAMRRVVRKDLTRQAMRDAGLPGPHFAVAHTWEAARRAAAQLGYPVVFKPVDLCAGMYVRRVDEPRALREAWDALAAFPTNARGQRRQPQVLLEELLTGPEVSVETVTVAGFTHVVGVTDKSLSGPPRFVETGHMFPAALDQVRVGQASEAAVAALAAVGWRHGVAHTELRLTPAGPRLIEINPRPAGNQITELIRRVTGIDLPMVHARLALGEHPDLTPTDTGLRSAAVAFLLPPRPGTVGEITGAEGLVAADVVDWAVRPPGHHSGAADSNNTYLGHVTVVDPHGAGAGARARALVDALSVRYADGPAVPA